jgi:hypothetical protein
LKKLDEAKEFAEINLPILGRVIACVWKAACITRARGVFRARFAVKPAGVEKLDHPLDPEDVPDRVKVLKLEKKKLEGELSQRTIQQLPAHYPRPDGERSIASLACGAGECASTFPRTRNCLSGC